MFHVLNTAGFPLQETIKLYRSVSILFGPSADLSQVIQVWWSGYNLMKTKVSGYSEDVQVGQFTDKLEERKVWMEGHYQYY